MTWWIKFENWVKCKRGIAMFIIEKMLLLQRAFSTQDEFTWKFTLDQVLMMPSLINIHGIWGLKSNQI